MQCMHYAEPVDPPYRFVQCRNAATEFWLIYEEDYFIDVEAYCDKHSRKDKNLSPELSHTLISETEAENLSVIIDVMVD